MSVGETQASPGLTCDTSVLVPALAIWHEAHDASLEALERVDSIAAHVLLETYSVLTRLPSPHRIVPAQASAALKSLGLHVLTLPADEHLSLVALIGGGGWRGGATYDALVAATAAHHGRRLLTRGGRARAIYDSLRLSYELV